MADELKELEKQRRAVSERIGEIEHERASKETAQYVGRFFKYRNCYSCPESDADYWPLYFKVTGNDGAYVTGFMFQRDNDGRCSTKAKAHRYLGSMEYEEITRDEWAAAWSAFYAELAQDEAK